MTSDRSMAKRDQGIAVGGGGAVCGKREQAAQEEVWEEGLIYHFAL